MDIRCGRWLPPKSDAVGLIDCRERAVSWPYTSNTYENEPSCDDEKIVIEDFPKTVQANEDSAHKEAKRNCDASPYDGLAKMLIHDHLIHFQ